MAWIRLIPPEEATGVLASVYREAIKRAGRVFNVLRIQSPRPHTLAASTRLYTEVMFSDRSPLSRAQREMIATTVSQVNDCHY